MIATLHRNNRGAEAVEFAIILSFLMTLLFGLFDFGNLFRYKLILTNAVREGVRAEIQGKSADEAIQEYVEAADLDWSDCTVSITTDPPEGGLGATVTVSLSYPFNFFLLPSWIPGFPQIQSLSSEAIMRYQGC